MVKKRETCLNMVTMHTRYTDDEKFYYFIFIFNMLKRKKSQAAHRVKLQY